MKTFIIRPLITEKTMGLVGRGWYTFMADVDTDKKTAKQEIEKMYAVSVLDVRSALMHGKVQRVGRKSKIVRKTDWKKIMVQLKSGQTIDAFQIGGSEEQK